MESEPANKNMESNTSANWTPAEFSVGDVVIDVNRPKWGKGKVVENRTYRRSPTCGQRLYIEFEHRGLVMVFTAQRVLKLMATDMPDA